MKNILIALLIALGLSIGGQSISLATSHSPTEGSSQVQASARPAWMKTPCKQAHSVNCFHAGKGHDFIVRQLPGSAGMVCVFYINKQYAQGHDYCS